MKSKLPTGRLRRAFDMARVGARAGASWAASRGADAAAHRSAEVLGNLRGIAAKVGQTASYVDGLVPPEQREIYERALKKLQKATPASSIDSVKTLFREELGRAPEELFSEFEQTPIASASIGQVHRAVLHDGRRVAVKVQHEGVAEAVESDLRNVGMLEGVINLAGPRGLQTGPIFEEVLRRFRQELDYRVEARNQKAFADLHHADPMIRIPEVIDAFSSQRVLTSEWVDGKSLEEAAASDSETRKAYASTLWRFVFRGNLVGGAFNADPHPGNYLFHADGGVTFLDFGCVQPISEPTRKAAVLAHQAIISGDHEGFGQAIALMLGTRGGAFGEASLKYTTRCFEPLMSESYHLTSDYAADLMKEAQKMKKSMSAKDGSFVSPPAHLALMNRLQFGFFSVLAQLEIAAPYQSVEREFLEEAASLERGILSHLD